MEAPHSLEAEQSLIGGLLIDNSAWDRIADQVREADFYRDDHRRIFRHLRLLLDRGQKADVVTVWASIEAANEADQAGGLAYLGEIANATPSAANVKHYAEIVLTKAKLRHLLAIGAELQQACVAPGPRKPADLVAEVERQLATEMDEAADEPSALADVLNDALGYIDDRREASGLMLGYESLDRIIGGLEPGQLVVVAARPSVGKTAFACNIADLLVARGLSVFFQTLEMSRREVGLRILSARTNVPVLSMRTGIGANETWDQMTRTVAQANGHKLWIDDTGAVGVPYIRARARRIKRSRGLDAVIIDYLQLMAGKGDTRNHEVGSISRGLKALAKELQIPIIVLAQVNRKLEERTDRRPVLSDLRDSGEVEQDADIVLMLHREELYANDPDHWRGFAELIVRKNRNGPLGSVSLEYDGEVMKFSTWTRANPRSAMRSEQGGIVRRSRGFPT